eukprot:8497327-Pyramimonas_sp.AAC.1
MAVWAQRSSRKTICHRWVSTLWPWGGESRTKGFLPVAGGVAFPFACIPLSATFGVAQDAG